MKERIELAIREYFDDNPIGDGVVDISALAHAIATKLEEPKGPHEWHRDHNFPWYETRIDPDGNRESRPIKHSAAQQAKREE